ncbi:MFS general substrate transporter [Venturia nashicola]|nr:MFS general substrate transporter [Venturia nashicola]
MQRKVKAAGFDNGRHYGISERDWDSNGRAQTFLVESGTAEKGITPRTWSLAVRIRATIIIRLILFFCGYASAMDSTILKKAAPAFGVSKFAENFSTSIFLFGIAFGGLVSRPLSETAGRNLVYLITMGLYMICIMITALAPNLPVQLIFRFFAGLFASPTLTINGGRSSITFMRYTVSAGMVIADRSMHKIMGVHWTETMLGYLGAAALLEVWASDQEQK